MKALNTILAVTTVILGAATLTTDASADRFPGPGFDRDVLEAGQSKFYYNQVFAARENAILAVVGDGDGDIDCYVTDQNGNVVGSDNDSLDNCYVAWRPIWTGTFTIRVTNNGRAASIFVLRTN